MTHIWVQVLLILLIGLLWRSSSFLWWKGLVGLRRVFSPLLFSSLQLAIIAIESIDIKSFFSFLEWNIRFRDHLPSNGVLVGARMVCRHFSKAKNGGMRLREWSEQGQRGEQGPLHSLCFFLEITIGNSEILGYPRTVCVVKYIV